MPEADGRQAAGPAHEATPVQVLDHRGRRALRSLGQTRDRERQACRRGQPPLEMRGETIGRHDIEADARHQHDACPPGLGVARGARLEHRHLARDVEIRDAVAQTGVDHGARRVRERPRAVEHGPDPRETAIDRGRIAEIEHPGLESERGGDLLHGRRVPAGEDGPLVTLDGVSRDQPPGVAVRAVDQVAGCRAVLHPMEYTWWPAGAARASQTVAPGGLHR